MTTDDIKQLISKDEYCQLELKKTTDELKGDLNEERVRETARLGVERGRMMASTMTEPFETLDGNNIVIKAQPRQGWAEAAKRAHENGDDELLIPNVFEDEKFED